MPHNLGGKSFGALTQFSIGDTHQHVNGLANGVTTYQLAAVHEAHTKSLPRMIDQRVQDRQKRGHTRLAVSLLLFFWRPR